MEQVLNISREENLAMIAESVAFLKAAGREVIYDAEHFFDGFDEDPEYALQSLFAALDNGADAIVLCDTNGGALPLLGRIRNPDGPTTTATNRRLSEGGSAKKVDIGIHTHNDSGLAVANTITAVHLGGYGARHHQRLRRALRQCRPQLDHSDPLPENEPALHVAGKPFKIKITVPFRQRNRQPGSDQHAPLCGPERLRPQRRHSRQRHHEGAAGL